MPEYIHNTPRRPAARGIVILRIAVIVLALFLLLFGAQTAALYTDSQWFAELGQSGVFRTVLGARLTLFFGIGLLFFGAIYLNLWIAQRLNATRTRPLHMDMDRQAFGETLRRVIHRLAFGGSVLLAFLVGGNAATHWSEYLQFIHAGHFGQTDPVFGNDIGFYLFRLPFLEYLQGVALFALLLTTILTALLYWSDGQIDFLTSSLPIFTGYVRRHLLILLSGVVLLYALGTLFGRYELLTRDNGAFFGAGYTDLHARLPAMNFQIIALVLTAALCIVNLTRGRAFVLPLGGLAAWLVVTAVGQFLLPGMTQRFTVIPNQLAKEQPYITHDIAFTRRAYGLENAEVQVISGSQKLTAQALASDQATLDNVRLWDWVPLGAVYSANQTFKSYYRFILPPNTTQTAGDFNIDTDRYRLGDRTQQVMIAPRELDVTGLSSSAQTWQNLHLQYTHGYGAVMSPVNKVNAGLPEYYLSQIPVQSSRPELKLDVPQIYFGELTRDYVFVNTKQSEFDYAAQEGDQQTRYTGKAGVPLGGSLNRLAWSVRLGDTNMILSSDLTETSRLLFRRGIRERVQTLAPFLHWDNDPYAVVNEGRLVWMLDGYTVSNRYPYSKPTTVGTGMPGVSQEFNYIRNAVKATIDAYDGTVTLYVADANDPVIRLWQRVFPDLLHPLSEMPQSLREHIRYPEDMFRIQRDIYALYHITDAQEYFRKEDAWVIPAEVVDSGGSSSEMAQRRLQPYYLMMRLPGEKTEEFIMMTPFTPLGKPNMAAWMCARTDGEHYGELRVYRFDRGNNVNGPQQIIGLINQLQAFSEKKTLLNANGSRLSLGNLLILPIESSVLYAVPVYIQSSDSNGTSIPEINQVILVTGNTVVMRPTFQEALAALTEQSGGAVTAEGGTTKPTTTEGGASPTEGGASPTALSRPGSLPELLRRVRRAYDQARLKQKEYDRSLDDLGKALDELQKGTPVPSP